MKNLKNLKSWAFAFAICALAAVASCSKDEDNTDNTGTETVAVPTNLSAGSITATTAELSWTSDASQFKIKINDGTYTSAVAKYSAASLTPGTAYTWQVQALKGEAESDWSASSSFTTPAGSVTPPPPATLTTPTNLRIYETVTYYGADFAWDTDALYFELQVISEANDTSKYSGAMTDFSADWYVVNNLQPETNYTWRVRVTNDIAGAEDSFSAWANGSNFTTAAAPPPPPPIVSAQVRYGSGDDAVTWNAGAYAIVPQGPVIFVYLFRDAPADWNNLTYPYVYFVIPGTTLREYTYAEFENSFMLLYNNVEDYDHGNTEDGTNSIELTEYANNKLSALVTTNIEDYINGGVVSLSITLLNLDVTNDFVVLE